MAEIEKALIPYEVDYICDTCGKGNMRPTGITYPTYPAKIEHQCNYCFHKQSFIETTYPTVRWKENK